MSRFKYFSSTVLLLFLGCFASCWHRGSEQVSRFSGTLELTEHALGFPVSGRVAVLHVDEGDEVKLGQEIARLERYALARREYERLADLLQKGGTHRQAVEEAEQNMLDQRVLAPTSGIVLTKVHDTGEVVGSNSPLLILGDRSQVWVRIFVPEGLVNRVRLGQKAQVYLDGIAESLSGTVRYVAPQAEFTPRNVQTPEERVTQTFAVKVYLDDPSLDLKVGVPADVTLALSESLPHE